MGRPPARGTGPNNEWSLEQVCRAAGVTRAAGRTAIRHGLLRSTGWQARDVPVLAAAAGLLNAPSPHGPGATAERNRRAIVELKAALADGHVSAATVLVAGADRTALVEDAAGGVLTSFPPEQTVFIIPVGHIAAATPGVIATS